MKKLSLETRSNLQMEDFSVDCPLNDQEKLVGKLILLSKMHRGLESRTKRTIGALLGDAFDSETRDRISDTITEGYDIGYDSAKAVYLEVAKSMGIDEKRFKEIRDWVYERETQI